MMASDGGDNLCHAVTSGLLKAETENIEVMGEAEVTDEMTFEGTITGSSAPEWRVRLAINGYVQAQTISHYTSSYSGYQMVSRCSISGQGWHWNSALNQWSSDANQLAEVEVDIANETQFDSKGCNFGGPGIGNPGVDDHESGVWDSPNATIKVQITLYAFTNIATGRADDMYCQSGAMADMTSPSSYAHAYDGATLIASWLLF